MNEPDNDRLQRAMTQAAWIGKRAGEPYERIASVESTCPACGIIILAGDLIASPVIAGASWRHLKCAICQKCGAWRTVEGACGNDCAAEQAEPDSGSWHDVSCTLVMPVRAISILMSTMNAHHAPWYRVITAHESKEPQTATTLSVVRVHSQIYIKDAPDPSQETINREVTKAIGLRLGNVYDTVDVWRVMEVAYDIGCVVIEDTRKLTRPPTWAANMV